MEKPRCGHANSRSQGDGGELFEVKCAVYLSAKPKGNLVPTSEAHFSNLWCVWLLMGCSHQIIRFLFVLISFSISDLGKTCIPSGLKRFQIFAHSFFPQLVLSSVALAVCVCVKKNKKKKTLVLAASWVIDEYVRFHTYQCALWHL